MIVDRILIVRNLDKQQVELFSNYSAYQEWLMEKANPIKRPFLAWQFSLERQKEAKLERKYGLPQFVLRGVLHYLSYQSLKDILSKAAAQQHSLMQLIKAIRRVANGNVVEEPYPIQLPIKAIIKTGDEIGSAYYFNSYDSYFNWKLSRSSLLEKFRLIEKDLKHRKQELLLEARFGKEIGYFRGIYSIDYCQIKPLYKPEMAKAKSQIFERAASFKQGFDYCNKLALWGGPTSE